MKVNVNQDVIQASPGGSPVQVTVNGNTVSVSATPETTSVSIFRQEVSAAASGGIGPQGEAGPAGSPGPAGPAGDRLENLGDVSLTSVQDGDVLRFSGNGNNWQNHHETNLVDGGNW